MADNPNPQAAQAVAGLNLNGLNPAQGQVSYALNAVIEGIDGKGVSYQNEPGNVFCTSFPEGYRVMGKKAVLERDLAIFFLHNPKTGDSEIGQVKDCVYTALLNSPCLNFSPDHPIHKVFYRINYCGLELFWTDGFNPRRYLNLDQLPWVDHFDGCSLVPQVGQVDCNKLLVQPNFSIPQLVYQEVSGDGQLQAGAYQFAVQYANRDGEGYTAYYSVTNPLPIHDPNRVTLDFNYEVNKAISLQISGIESSGVWEYLNVAAIITVNNITRFELVGTYRIDGPAKHLTYSGQKLTNLSEGDIFEKFPIYPVAQDLYSVQGILGWADLSEAERVNYQGIASQITLDWETLRLPKDAYKNPLHAATHRGYLRDEIYPFEIVFILRNGKQTDGFHIPGREATQADLDLVEGPDTLAVEDACTPEHGAAKPRWQVYNTATVEEENLGPDPCLEDFGRRGSFAYWESTETYPCNKAVWGPLAGRPIRHHKMPDALSAPLFEDGGEVIQALGVRVNVQQVLSLVRNSSLSPEQKAQVQGFKIVRGNRASGQKSVIAKGILTNVGRYDQGGSTYYFPNYGSGNDLREDPFIGAQKTANDDPHTVSKRLRAYDNPESHSRFSFHSPDTHFYQPTLGNVLKLDTAITGTVQGHFVPVKNHAKYQLLSTGAYLTALAAGGLVGLASLTFGVSDQPFDGTAAFTAFKALVDIMEKVIPRVSYAYQFTSVGSYTHSLPLPEGVRQRSLDIASYAAPGMINVGDLHTLNNRQRESSVYLRTTAALPYPHEVSGVVQDQSRWRLGDGDCKNPDALREAPCSTFYGAIKQNLVAQWGQLYSYETIDTGFQWTGDIKQNLPSPYQTFFGGDTFLGRFAYKSKLPFFLDHRINNPDGSDVFYNEIPNVGYPLYWLSTDAIRDFSIIDLIPMVYLVRHLFGVKANNFDCSGTKFFYQDGKFYLFAYGIPSFITESEVNVELRSAFNGAEGDFYPRVGSGIPDDWLQYVNTPIEQDNTYHYNKSYSKQSKENFFSHYPEDWQDCLLNQHFLTIYSDPGDWHLYRPLSKFTFPQTLGKLTSIDALENRELLVRFETRSQLYNAMLTVNTSTPQAAYLGNDSLFKSSPALDFSEADSGYTGSQHKMLVHTPFGPLYVDGKRGDVFLVQRQQFIGNRPVEISTPEVAKYLTQHLSVDEDNHFNGRGITGVFDPLFSRVLLTKLDGKESFTLSYSFLTRSWISLHSYLPRFYLEHPQTFYSSEGDSLWQHSTDITLYNHYYGRPASYVIEYPFPFGPQDEILQSVRDNATVLRYQPDGSYTETDNTYFTQAILHNSQECSGVLNLIPRPKNSLKAKTLYPIYRPDSKDILVAKSNSGYNFNQFWNVVTPGRPIWKPSVLNLSVYKDLNQGDMNYAKRSHHKGPIQGRDLKIRLISTHTDHRIVSRFIFQASQPSYK